MSVRVRGVRVRGVRVRGVRVRGVRVCVRVYACVRAWRAYAWRECAWRACMSVCERVRVRACVRGCVCARYLRMRQDWQ